MFALITFCLIIGTSYAAPGLLDLGGYGGYGGFGGHSGGLIASAPIVHSAPVVHSAPIVHAAPIIKPVVEHITYAQPAPIYHAPQPIVKVAAAPIVKSYAPATSYATVTTYKVAHVQPVVKAIVQQPTIIKTLEPSYGHGFGYHGFGGHGYHR